MIPIAAVVALVLAGAAVGCSSDEPSAGADAGDFPPKSDGGAGGGAGGSGGAGAGGSGGAAAGGSGGGGAGGSGGAGAGGSGGAAAGGSGGAGSGGSGGAGSGGSGGAGAGGSGGGAGSGGAAGAGGVATVAWPGTAPVVTVDVADTFGTDVSGLHHQPAANGAPAVLWAVQNSPSKLYRLLWNGTNWVPDAGGGWRAGKRLHYRTGAGAPDGEGVTMAEWTDTAIYVATEHDGNANEVSRLSILRFDSAAAGSELTATNDWNVTADLPAVGANLGLEAIAYVPDTALVAGHFFDEAAHAPYAPASYPNHGAGLFFVGVEGTGAIHVYALDHAGSGFTRVASFGSGQASIMDLAYDRERGYLWGYCDKTCGNKATIFRLDGTAMSPTAGRFQVSRVFNRPASLPNTNNEGISFAPESECAGGQKPFFWADDDQTNGHALRRGSIACGNIF